VILALDPVIYCSLPNDALGSTVKAVRDGRIYVAPILPYAWFDAPPGVNRFIGVRWLASVLDAKAFPESLGDTTRDFYKLFYHVDLTKRQIHTLLTQATSAKPERRHED
jgi:iron complex transport system substrate-binding protein